MALSATTTLPHSVDSVAAVLVNEDFQRHVSQLVGGTLESFTVDGDIAGAFNTTSVRTLPTTRLPEIARKFVGEHLKVTQVANWEAPAADGSRQSNISLKIWPQFLRRVMKDPRARDAAGKATKFLTVHVVLVGISMVLGLATAVIGVLSLLG